MIGNVLHGLRPGLMMVLVQVILAGMYIFYKVASNAGMTMRVLIAYRFIFASATIIPLALFFERNNRPKLTWMILTQAFFCALFGGSLAQNIYAESLLMTSTTFATAIMNLIPAFTFIMGSLLRVEKVGLRSMAGKAKVVGTLLGIGGAMLLTFYKGVEIKMWSGHETTTGQVHARASSSDDKQILGSVLALSSCILAASSFIIQAKMSSKYPCYYSGTALVCVFGAIQSVVYALVVDREWGHWKLGWNTRLLASVYSGTLASGLSVAIMMWCVRMRGPLFITIFNPLTLVLVAFGGSIFLSEKLYLGSVVGAVVIICGLYAVLWGKSREMKKVNRLMPEEGAAVVISSRNGGGVGGDDDDQDNNNKSSQPCSSVNVVMGVNPNFMPPPSTLPNPDRESNSNIEVVSGDLAAAPPEIVEDGRRVVHEQAHILIIK